MSSIWDVFLFIELQKILDWLQDMESKMSTMGPIPSDTAAVKKQMDELKVQKTSISMSLILKT